MKALRFVFCLICTIGLTSAVAYAYIDPATTSYVVQIIAGVVLAGGAALGIYWHKLKRFFKGRKASKGQEQ